MEPMGRAAGFGADGKPRFWIESDGPSVQGRLHIALQADDRATVDAFHAAALAAGATDHGAPGVRAIYHPDYYGALRARSRRQQHRGRLPPPCVSPRHAGSPLPAARATAIRSAGVGCDEVRR